MNHRITIARGLLAAVAIAGCTLASAQQHDDGYWVSVAGYRPGIASTGRSDLLINNRPGTEVSFEDELGLADRKTLPWFQAGMRLGEHWRMELEYFALKRNGTRSISRDIAWGDTVFPATTTLSSTFDSEILRVSVGRSFVHTPQTELGAVIGLHMTRFAMSLAGQASIGTLSGSTRVEGEDALVPLPTIGVYGRHDFARGWSIAGRIDYFGLSYGDYRGNLINLMAAVGYRFTDRLTASLGYRYVDYAIELNKTDWKGSIDYRFRGPYIGLQLGF